MNDKDKEAFNEWRNSTSTRLDIHDAWQAACKYKDKELMEWKEAARSEANIVDELQAENKKLREALEFYADSNNWGEMFHKELLIGRVVFYFTGGKKAREALKEVEKKDE